MLRLPQRLKKYAKMLKHLNNTPQWPARTVIIGSGGFVGGAVQWQLEKAGASVLGLTRKDVDLLQPDAAATLAGLLRPGDTVVAVSARAPCKDAAMLRENIVMAEAMVTALQKDAAIHVVNITSDAVFGDSPTPLTEASERSPSSFHGVMHLAREVMFAGLPNPVATLRPTLIYGVDDPHNGYGPNQFRRKAEAGTPITLFGEGEERRDHIWVEDVAALVGLTVQHRSTGSLNLASGEVFSFREVASMVVNLFPAPVRITGSPRKGPMPHNGYRPFDIAAMRAAFPSFRPQRLPAGLEAVHNQLRK